MRATLEPSVPLDWDEQVRPAKTQGYWSLDGALSTRRFYLGMAEERGLTLRRIVLVNASATLALDSTGAAIYSFRPFVSTVKDGTETLRYLGPGRATSAYSLVQGVVFRLHDDEVLNEKMPVGMTCGVDVTKTGAPAAVNALFQAYYAITGR